MVCRVWVCRRRYIRHHRSQIAGTELYLPYILAFSPKCFLLMLAVETILALIVGYSAVIPITAAVAFPVIHMIFGGCWMGFALYMIAASIVEIKHIENIRRIRAGTEIRVSYLWNKEKELLRIQKNSKSSRR